MFQRPQWFMLLLCSHNLSTVNAVNIFNVYGLAQAIAKRFFPQPHPQHPSSRPNRGSGIKVIDASCGRNGRLAPPLETFGFDPFGFWDAFPMLKNNKDKIDWDTFLEKKDFNKTQLIQNITTQGFNAVVGFPGCLLYQELMSLYPDSKVILPVGYDASLQWADDAVRTVLGVVQLSYRKPFTFLSNFNNLRNAFNGWIFWSFGIPIVVNNKTIYEGKSLVLPDRVYLAASYDEWVATVRKVVPKHRLYIVSPSNDGWRPLCDFLSPLDPIVIKKRCRVLLFRHKPAIDDDGAKFVIVLAVMTLIANLYDQLPRLVLLAVFVMIGFFIFFTEMYRSRKNQAKEKAD